MSKGKTIFWDVFLFPAVPLVTISLIIALLIMKGFNGFMNQNDDEFFNTIGEDNIGWLIVGVAVVFWVFVIWLAL